MYKDCTEVSLPHCPVKATIYGYYPSLPANAFFLAWFAILLIPNIIFGIRYKAWTYMLALGLGCTDEAIGYVGRVMLHQNPWSVTGFQIQICCLILGPAFNSAAIYLTLKHVALTFDPEYSIIKPRWYTYIFITGDLISLVLQAIGGGMAATAGEDRHQQNLGTHIMVAGICFQVVTLLIFAACASFYVWRRHRGVKNGHQLSKTAAQTLADTRFRLFVLALITAFIAVFARCVYRIAEMAGGWANKIMRDEPSYIALEGALIAYATAVQTLLHPGYCFPQLTGRKNEKEDDALEGASNEVTETYGPGQGPALLENTAMGSRHVVSNVYLK